MSHNPVKGPPQANASAQLNLGKMCDDGQGGPQDYVQAHGSLNLAVSSSSLSGAHRHGEEQGLSR